MAAWALECLRAEVPGVREARAVSMVAQVPAVAMAVFAIAETRVNPALKTPAASAVVAQAVAAVNAGSAAVSLRRSNNLFLRFERFSESEFFRERQTGCERFHSRRATRFGERRRRGAHRGLEAPF